jgi:4-hydroxyacetophenone monooxygenase
MTTPQAAALNGGPISASDDDLRAAATMGNIPTMLMALAFLTGQSTWFEPPYRPTRTKALDDNDTGGLPEETQAEVREALVRVVGELRDGVRAMPEPCSDGELLRLVSASLGQEVPSEYARTLAEESGFRPRIGSSWSAGRPETAAEMHVVIIGAGFSGVAAARILKELGISFQVYERGDGVGGVWNANRYPGAGADAPSHLYSYSFAPKPNWSRYYAKQPEIRSYIESAAESFGILDKIQLNSTVTAATWDDADRSWRVEVAGPDGTTHETRANAVISCVGILNKPVVPNLPGVEDFAGPSFHTAAWDDDVDLAGKKVAVIGTGATSIQLVPELAGVAEKVTVFQRTPQWFVPNKNYLRDVTPAVQLLMDQVPSYLAFYRTRLIWMFQDKLLATLRKDPEWSMRDVSVNAENERHRQFLLDYIDGKLGSRREVRPLFVPDYPPYGKRMLMDNDWLETVLRDDVDLVAGGVARVTEASVVTDDGSEYPVDVIIYATGFQSSRMLSSLEIVGRSGERLGDVWQDSPEAYLGVCVPGFPNLFVVGGPNTQLGHGGSAVYITECSLAYISDVLVTMVEQGLSSVDVRSDVSLAYNDRVQAEHAQLIWTHPAVNSWFANSSGRVVATTPWRGVDFWQMTRRADIEDFVVVKEDSPEQEIGA